MTKLADRETRKFWAQNNVSGKKGFQSTGGTADVGTLHAQFGQLTAARKETLDGIRTEMRGSAGTSELRKIRWDPTSQRQVSAAIPTTDTKALSKITRGYGAELGSDRISKILESSPALRSKFASQIVLLRKAPELRKQAFAVLRQPENLARVTKIDASAARKLSHGYSGDLSDSRLEALLYHIETGE